MFNNCVIDHITEVVEFWQTIISVLVSCPGAKGLGTRLVLLLMVTKYGHVTEGASHLIHSCRIMTAERARLTKWISSIPRACFMVSANLENNRPQRLLIGSLYTA